MRERWSHKKGRHCQAFIFSQGGKAMKKQTKAAKGSGSGNGFEEMVAIQLNVRFWPGQAKLKPADLGLDPKEVPKIFYLGTKKLYPQEIRQQFGQLSNKGRNCLNDHSFPFVMDVRREVA
jgi:hypothetical protein